MCGTAWDSTCAVYLYLLGVGSNSSCLALLLGGLSAGHGLPVLLSAFRELKRALPAVAWSYMPVHSSDWWLHSRRSRFSHAARSPSSPL